MPGGAGRGAAQVIALIAHLMECKDNYGPHLIIVPNAVMVNWKSELTQWLPSVRCVYYVGHKVRARRALNPKDAPILAARPPTQPRRSGGA